jgi:hypothetical protein
VRTGIVLSGGSYRSDDTSNYLGTYTFESLAAYEAGTPRSYTRRIGDPNIRYWNLQSAPTSRTTFASARASRSAPASATRRRPISTTSMRSAAARRHVGAVQERQNDAARQRGRLLRLAEQRHLRAIAAHRRLPQQELNILDPSFPDPGGVGIIPPINKYLLADDLQMAKNSRVSVGVDHAFTPKVRAGVTYAYVKGSGLLRGLNENAPIDGVRPNPAFGNVVEVVGDAENRRHAVNSFLQVQIAPPSPNPSRQLWNWKRTNFGINYNWARLQNNTDGAFSVPATGSLAAEWGPGGDDVHHRLNAFFGTQALRNFNANLNLSMSTAPPYTIRSGTDLNGDLIFNDRPLGVAGTPSAALVEWTSRGSSSTRSCSGTSASSCHRGS